jgi:CMP/dCMP kinase
MGGEIMNGHYAIAIDGPSGAGKSTIARAAASDYGFIYVDTGAIYRTVGLAAFNNELDRRDETAVAAILPELNIEMKYSAEGEQRMYLNGTDVSKEIRRPEISICASDVAALPAVRAFLLELQRKMARENSVIMDGRDIGTVVLPDAELKIFLTASAEARAQRRMLELENKGIKSSFEEVLRDIEYRDAQDSGRAAAPLKRADDAVEIDTSSINFDESLKLVESVIEQHLKIGRRTNK